MIAIVKRMCVSIGGTLAAALLLSPFWPGSVKVAQLVAGLKSDQLVMVCIFDGPTGYICLDPMTRQEANGYQDAVPGVYRFGTAEYVDALVELQVSKALYGMPSTGFRLVPAANESLVKQSNHLQPRGSELPVMANGRVNSGGAERNCRARDIF